MQQVQDLLEFNIDTPDDNELRKAFGKAAEGFEDFTRKFPDTITHQIAQTATTRNQKKRARRKSRRNA